MFPSLSCCKEEPLQPGSSSAQPETPPHHARAREAASHWLAAASGRGRVALLLETERGGREGGREGGRGGKEGDVIHSNYTHGEKLTFGRWWRRDLIKFSSEVLA